MKKLLTFVFALALIVKVSAQDNYFIDGFHGGVYGHYPLKTYTQFMVDQLNMHPEWNIGLEIEPETWDSVKYITPDAYHAFRTYVMSNRVEYTNPSYAQSYLYNINGESIIRQFYYGIRKLHEHFPGLTFTTYASEEPCFTSCLPLILKGFGMEFATTKCPNTCWGGYVEGYGGQLVNWIGPDGSRVLTVPRYACEALQDSSVWQTTGWSNQPAFLNACKKAGIDNPAAMCYQDAGWTYGPWLRNHLNGTHYVRWTDYIRNHTPGTTTNDWKFSQEDIRVALMWGTQVLQRIAQEVRQAENTLVQSEKLAAMAHITSGYVPNQVEIDEAWRTLMLSQHHDSWIVPYNRLQGKITWADAIHQWTNSTLQSAQDNTHRALTAMASSDIGNTHSVRIINTTANERTEVVSVPTSEGVKTFMATVPPFGYVTYALSSLNAKLIHSGIHEIKINKTECVLENDRYQLCFNLAKGGVVTSLIDKKNHGKKYVSNKGGYYFGELKGFFQDYNRFCSSTEQSATATVIQDDELVKKVKIEGHIAGTPFSQTITLTQGSPRIDYNMCIEWANDRQIGEPWKNQYAERRTSFYNTRYMLNVYFPTAFEQKQVYKDAPFDVCKSSLQDTFFNRWDSIKNNVVLNWVDVYDGQRSGLALFSDHTTSYSHGSDVPLALTVQYSGNGLWGRDYSINGPTEIKFALVPHQDTWDKAGINTLLSNWCEPLLTQLLPSGGSDMRSLVNLDGSSYQICAAYVEDSDVVLRLYNAEGNNNQRTISFGFNLKSADETDFNGKVLRHCKLVPHGNQSEVTVSIPRFGVKTLRLKLN